MDVVFQETDAACNSFWSGQKANNNCLRQTVVSLETDCFWIGQEEDNVVFGCGQFLVELLSCLRIFFVNGFRMRPGKQ